MNSNSKTNTKRTLAGDDKIPQTVRDVAKVSSKTNTDIKSMIKIVLYPDKQKVILSPKKIDLRNIFVLGTAIFLLGLVVTSILLFFHAIGQFPVFVAASGVLVGFLLLLWERANRKNYFGS
jgi:hypothetical protein